mgnify:CR=1 FL=1
MIDLDTVMPGLTMHDFGNSIRFGASTAAEDEVDLEKEVEMLPFGAKIMTYECGIRFLTDYLEEDHYFKIHRENHNLDCARIQFKLVADMEQKWETMKEIVSRY